MMYLLKFSNLHINSILYFVTNTYGLANFMGHDVEVDPNIHIKHSKEFYCSDPNISMILEGIWNKYIEKAKFYYCASCGIMRAFYNIELDSGYINTICCIPLKNIQIEIGLKFFELSSLMNTKTSMLHIPREELVIHLL